MATREGFHGYGPEQGYEWLRHAIAENDYRAQGHRGRGRRGLRQRRLEVRLRQHPRHPRRAEQHRDHRPGLSRLCGYERDGRAHRRGRRERRVRRAGLSEVHGGERLRRRAAAGARGRHLPLLSEQPDRRGGHARAARGVGRRTRASISRSSSSMRPTRRTSATRRCRIPSTKFPARASARSSSAASRRTADSPARAAPSSSCRRRCWPRPRAASASRCIRSGCAGTRRNSTASPTSCSAAPRRSIRPKARRRSRR